VRKPEPFDSYNAGYVQAVYEEYIRNPGAVDEAWRRLFEGADGAGGFNGVAAPAPAGAPAAAAAPDPTGLDAGRLRAAMLAVELVDAYRMHGYRAARLDPLGSEPRGHPMLAPDFHRLTMEELGELPAALLGLERGGATVAEVLSWLQGTFSGTIGYEYEHLDDPARRQWLREQIESGAHRAELDAAAQRRILERLTEVEAFEQFIHRAYLGQKRFSIEGNDMMVPMLDLAIECAVVDGAREVVMGMAHRGRLNVLVHVLNKPYAALLEAFEGIHSGSGTGDVKYHLGAEGTHATPAGDAAVTLAPNPSHLEFINPIVEGIARVKQADRTQRELVRNPRLVLPVLIHGDAAFAGQGVVAETLNLAGIDGYRTGGTLHVIANNQVGFTTNPSEARSTDFASDMARGFEVPIFHVNADDPEACLAVVRLALAYRREFEGDVVIDLVGYRRFGHNEGDEPAYTQPRLYRRIAEHPTVRRIWADRLVERGVLDEAAVEAIWNERYQVLADAQEEVKRRADGQPEPEPPPVEPATLEAPLETAVAAERLLQLDRQVHRWPDGFAMHPKLRRQLERRGQVLTQDGTIDWAHAEALAFASLVVGGTPIRLSGQDSQRGTFSQRHLVVYDVETGASFTPLAHLDDARAPFEVYNSPLSEVGVLGFEYGYSSAAPRSLVLWEAQFGDFVNVAQVILDQFLASGRTKWGQQSRLVLLLPHGYEGQGPEHSSARLERFLQLAAEDNIRVANCTTPAQYFHLLRRQALLEERRPLVVFTPKSLLRHPKATSRLADLAEGGYNFVIDDEGARRHADRVTRLVLCSGKVYYDLAGSRERDAAAAVAVARLEHLYPFPAEVLGGILDGYPALQEIVWTQEEPANMGGWTFVEPRLRELAGDRLRVGYVGRPERASPAEGFYSAHERQQAAIVQAAFHVPELPGRRRRRAQTA
jgi:2-oxoglutarate dehydrogenase E1 component